MSYYISIRTIHTLLTTFHAHTTFCTHHYACAILTTEVTTPPFEVTETGWGEFEAGIRLIFRDGSEQPLDLFHQIRLYPPASQQQVSTKKVCFYLGCICAYSIKEYVYAYKYVCVVVYVYVYAY
ncbi:hypothetical protein EON63_09740 [archaeon]|nr:MAG: hypothetical protein EON63_09740 [archaeon]